MGFEGKVAVVTGAAKGIGKAAALAFGREGAAVALVDFDEPRGSSAALEVEAAGCQALFIAANITSEEAVRKMVDQVVERLGRLDILVNNAAIYRQGDILSTSTDDWRAILETNLDAAYFCIKYAVPAMLRKGGGVIVNIASEAGLVGIKGQVAYNVSKGALIALTRSCSVDLAGRGIRVNCVCPGTTDTPLVREAVARARDPAAARRHLEEVRPLNRLGTVEEIAAAILFLAGDQAGYATGAVLSVDGGYTAQ